MSERYLHRLFEYERGLLSYHAQVVELLHDVKRRIRKEEHELCSARYRITQDLRANPPTPSLANADVNEITDFVYQQLASEPERARSPLPNVPPLPSSPLPRDDPGLTRSPASPPPDDQGPVLSPRPPSVVSLTEIDGLDTTEASEPLSVTIPVDVTPVSPPPDEEPSPTPILPPPPQYAVVHQPRQRVRRAGRGRCRFCGRRNVLYRQHNPVCPRAPRYADCQRPRDLRSSLSRRPRVPQEQQYFTVATPLLQRPERNFDRPRRSCSPDIDCS